MIHRAPESLLNQQVRIHLVGCGGNGSQMLGGLARLDRAICALGHPGGLHVTAFDYDRVSEANVGRQLFSPADVGQSKAAVLVQRHNLFFGTDWKAVPESYEGMRNVRHEARLVITCVDNAKTRRQLHRQFQKAGPVYWLDLGNRQTDGQVVLGEPLPRTEWRANGNGPRKVFTFKDRLPTVIDLFPELLDETIPEDNTPSCSLAEALEQQDLFINQSVATWALQLLWRLFRAGGIEHHGYFINLAEGRVAPILVPEPKSKKRKEAKK